MRAGALVVTFVLLAPVCAVRVTQLLNLAGQGLHEMSGNPEQRRLAAYGDGCNARGYGYLRRVMKAYPDRDSLPVIRHGEYDRHLSALYPQLRLRTERRILVGIDITAADFEEAVMPMAGGNRTSSRWSFTTGRDVDLLTGLRVRVDAVAAARRIEFVLYESPKRTTVMTRGAIDLPAGAVEGTWRAAAPIERFSIGRGRVPFVVDVQPETTAVDAIVVPVDGRGLEVVAASQRCLTAVERGFRRAHEGTGDAWSAWLADVQDIR
jgi:hypothetical protein